MIKAVNTDEVRWMPMREFNQRGFASEEGNTLTAFPGSARGAGGVLEDGVGRVRANRLIRALAMGVTFVGREVPASFADTLGEGVSEVLQAAVIHCTNLAKKTTPILALAGGSVRSLGSKLRKFIEILQT